jgi:chromosome condensin MukBEF ATPase and DNA-binding subunit MukB
MEREIGALEARMENVENEVQFIRDDVREIRDALVTARGSWRTLSMVAVVSLSFGAFLAKALPGWIALAQ